MPKIFKFIKSCLILEHGYIVVAQRKIEEKEGTKAEGVWRTVKTEDVGIVRQGEVGDRGGNGIEEIEGGRWGDSGG